MWTNYAKGVRDYCGHKLPEGLVQNQKLDENIVTPTTKDDEHDRLISPEVCYQLHHFLIFRKLFERVG